MAMEGPIQALEVLKRLGFWENPQVEHFTPGTLSFDCGNLQLSAVLDLNRRFRDVVLLFGMMRSPRSFGFIEHEIPTEFESFAQGIAWITWCLDGDSTDRFEPQRPVVWLEIGRKHFNLLPWIREQEAWEQRPRCSVERNWAKLVFSGLQSNLANVKDETTVAFEFDGKSLTICCLEWLVAIPATGKPWPECYRVKAELLRDLPKRIRQHGITVSVWDGNLEIGNRRYPVITEKIKKPCSLFDP